MKVPLYYLFSQRKCNHLWNKRQIERMRDSGRNSSKENLWKYDENKCGKNIWTESQAKVVRTVVASVDTNTNYSSAKCIWIFLTANVSERARACSQQRVDVLNFKLCYSAKRLHIIQSFCNALRVWQINLFVEYSGECAARQRGREKSKRNWRCGVAGYGCGWTKWTSVSTL